MNNSAPDFYLSSSEGYDLGDPRCCWRLKRLKTTKRDDLLLVRVNPPLIGQKYGLGGEDINLLVLAPRHTGVTLFPINEWPACVHVARLMNNNLQHKEIIDDEGIILIAWAELYQTEKAAKLKTT